MSNKSPHPDQHYRRSSFSYNGRVTFCFRGYVTLEDLRDTPALDSIVPTGLYYAEVRFVPLAADIRESKQFRAARKLFSDDASTEKWLCAAQASLGNLAPVELLDTDEGRKRVDDLVYAAMYGNFQ